MRKNLDLGIQEAVFRKHGGCCVMCGEVLHNEKSNDGWKSHDYMQITKIDSNEPAFMSNLVSLCKVCVSFRGTTNSIEKSGTFPSVMFTANRDRYAQMLMLQAKFEIKYGLIEPWMFKEAVVVTKECVANEFDRLLGSVIYGGDMSATDPTGEGVDHV